MPCKLDAISSILPRVPNNAEIIPLKLKRKLSYKGHYMHDYIRPKRVMSALNFLKTKNKLYKDVDICEDWETEWEMEDANTHT